MLMMGRQLEHVLMIRLCDAQVTNLLLQPDPTSLPSSMTIDGERMAAGAVQCHILPGAGRVMVK